MSHSEYYLFRQDGSLSEKTRMGNGFGSSPVLWDYLCKKYLGPTMSWLSNITRFWNEEALNQSLSTDDRFLLHMTYDQALLPRNEFRRAAELLNPFTSKERVSHWPEIVKMLLESADDEEILGFGIYSTSVSDNLWQYEVEDETKFKDARTARCVQYDAASLVPPALIR
jgi:hypothetical protein